MLYRICASAFMLLCITLLGCTEFFSQSLQTAEREGVRRRGLLAGRIAASAEGRVFGQLHKKTQWTLTSSIPLGRMAQANGHDLGHPQGLVKQGEHFWLTTVLVDEWPKMAPVPSSGPSRTLGRGRGMLYRFASSGQLTAAVQLKGADASYYHPGGLSYDGTHLWTAVAQYRPEGYSTIVRIDPHTLQVDTMFHVQDHIGALVHNVERGTLHGVTWGARRFITWQSSGARVGNELARFANGSHYVDYQDCQYVPRGLMLCGGVNHFKMDDATRWGLGGLDLVDLRSGMAVHQVPVLVNPRSGDGQQPVVLTQNPMFAEVVTDLPADLAANTGLSADVATNAAGRMRFYFVPEDAARATLYTYESTP